MAHTFLSQGGSRESHSRANPRESAILESEPLVTRLLEMPVWLPEAMEPGCLFRLSRRFHLSPKRDPRFAAVLACPQCGLLNMITDSQYAGQQPVVCESELCGRHFLIRDKSWFDYLPLH